MKRFFIIMVLTISGILSAQKADACTGISLTAQDGSNVVARTVEWAATAMQCGYIVAPRGHEHQSYTPTGANGLKYKGAYRLGKSRLKSLIIFPTNSNVLYPELENINLLVSDIIPWNNFSIILFVFFNFV